MSDELIDAIEAVLDSGVLLPDLVEIPEEPARPEAISATETAVGRKLSAQHRQILSRWDGIDLEVVRFLDAGNGDASIRLFSRIDPPSVSRKFVPVAIDPSGFTFLEDLEGTVWMWDHDGGKTEVVATDLRDFVCNYIFGHRAAEFGGGDWYDQLRSSGLIGQRE